MSWGIDEFINHLNKLLVPGLIGNYASFEVTEIFGIKGKDAPQNFLTLIVAEPGEGPTNPPARPPCLNSDRLTLKKNDWKFGVRRFRLTTQHVLNVIQHFSETREWKPLSDPLGVGKLLATPPQFVPADTYRPHP